MGLHPTPEADRGCVVVVGVFGGVGMTHQDWIRRISNVIYEQHNNSSTRISGVDETPDVMKHVVIK